MCDAERDFFTVFVRGRPPEAVVAWVEDISGPLTAPPTDEWPRLYESPRGRVSVGHISADDEVSVWFYRDGSWSDVWDRLNGCAAQASRDLGAVVLFFDGDRAMRVFREHCEPAAL